MFGLVRLVIFCLIAFTAGAFFERRSEAERCAEAGGVKRGAFCERAGNG